MNFTVELFALAVFIAVFLLIEGAYALWNTVRHSEARRLHTRLRNLTIEQAETSGSSLMKQRVFSDVPWLNDALRQVPALVRFDGWIRQSGQQSLTVGRFLLLTFVAVFGAMLLGAFIGVQWLAMLLLAALGAATPLLVVSSARNRRLQKFDEQLPEGLDLISRALRAGHAFPAALKMVATEAQDPIAGEFRITFDEINYGIPLPEAMRNMAARVPSLDLRYFIVAITLQRETGGNLAELLGNLSALIRERFKLHGKVRVLSAEGRMSGYVLGGLPFAAAGFIYLSNPKFLSLLWTDPLGQRMVSIAAVLMVVGALWMRSIVRIRV